MYSIDHLTILVLPLFFYLKKVLPLFTKIANEITKLTLN